mgnify:CR=1 FL=1
MKAIHNKDYSVVKTFSASSIYGAFFIPLALLLEITDKGS